MERPYFVCAYFKILQIFDVLEVEKFAFFRYNNSLWNIEHIFVKISKSIHYRKPIETDSYIKIN
jgi:hypothetical protein